MRKLGVSELEIVKISKKGGLKIFFDQFWGFLPKKGYKLDIFNCRTYISSSTGECKNQVQINRGQSDPL